MEHPSLCQALHKAQAQGTGTRHCEAHTQTPDDLRMPVMAENSGVASCSANVVRQPAEPVPLPALSVPGPALLPVDGVALGWTAGLAAAVAGWGALPVLPTAGAAAAWAGLAPGWALAAAGGGAGTGLGAEPAGLAAASVLGAAAAGASWDALSVSLTRCTTALPLQVARLGVKMRAVLFSARSSSLASPGPACSEHTHASSSSLLGLL